jgi:hypothetical protein
MPYIIPYYTIYTQYTHNIYTSIYTHNIYTPHTIAIGLSDIQEALAAQGYLHSRSRIELALDMLYLEGKAVVPRDLILSLDRLEVEEMLRIGTS